MKTYEPGQKLRITRDIEYGLAIKRTLHEGEEVIYVGEAPGTVWDHSVLVKGASHPALVNDWEVEAIEHISTVGGTEVQYRVEVINPGGEKITDFTMDTLAEAEEFRNSAERNDGYRYRILRIETTEVGA